MEWLYAKEFVSQASEDAMSWGNTNKVGLGSLVQLLLGMLADFVVCSRNSWSALTRQRLDAGARRGGGVSGRLGWVRTYFSSPFFSFVGAFI